ncbi:CBS domain-containing protein [Neolewinella antarctica]|uniref:CBS domain-containing protein n=1 Tax=Neolewinella antarctica TaxID=442734 RepID=A0ABX0XCW7_9BACT|nr:CBS domain-containing protein [Neolewinella antarctica]NJC26764.1 CBS domain-containing protein [Neolewinella antarctica]
MKLLTKVSALMSRNLITVTVHTPLAEAGELLVKHGIHHLPVVNATGGLEGIIGKSDFLKVFTLDRDTASVKDIMSTHLAKLEPDDTIRTAANLFALNKFHALPVIDGGRLVGIITTLDVIRFVDGEQTQLGDYAK